MRKLNKLNKLSYIFCSQIKTMIFLLYWDFFFPFWLCFIFLCGKAGFELTMYAKLALNLWQSSWLTLKIITITIMSQFTVSSLKIILLSKFNLYSICKQKKTIYANEKHEQNIKEKP